MGSGKYQRSLLADDNGHWLDSNFGFEKTGWRVTPQQKGDICHLRRMTADTGPPIIGCGSWSHECGDKRRPFKYNFTRRLSGNAASLAATMRLLNKETRAEALWMPCIQLVWLSYFVVEPAFQPFSVERWALTLVSTLIFLVFYFRGLRLKSTGMRLSTVAGIALLGGLFTSTGNYGANVFFIYAAAFAGFCEGMLFAILALMALEVCAGMEFWVFHLPFALWTSISLLIAAVWAMGIQRAKRNAANRRLVQAQEEIEGLAKTAERERIARDLHDVLGHTLSVIILKSELASRMADRDMDRAIKEIRDVEKIARESLAEVRSALKGYHSAGLDAEIAQARATLATAGIAAHTSANALHLGSAQEGVFALVIREAVTNILRHSQADECRLHLTEKDDIYTLEISDNGCGSDDAEGQGIKGMRQRVEALGGNLQRTTSPGTTITVVLPRAHKSDGAQ